MPGISTKLLDSSSQHLAVDLMIMGRLGNRNTPLPDQIYCLKLELATKLLSLQLIPPVPSKHLNSMPVKPAVGHRNYFTLTYDL
jgi:hypothetical protein